MVLKGQQRKFQAAWWTKPFLILSSQRVWRMKEWLDAQTRAQSQKRSRDGNVERKE